MNAQYHQNLLPSFGLFIDHSLCAIGQAFTNYSGNLYLTTGDPNFAGYRIWGTPYRQFIADSSIANATIASGVYYNGNFIPNGTSGINIDYLRGRAISTGNSSINQLSTAYSAKDFNIYFTQISEERLLFELAPKLPQQSKIGIPVTQPLDYLDQPYPAIWIRMDDSLNEPFALGGMDTTNTTIKTIILSDTDWKLDGSISIFEDSARKYFPVFTGSQFPFTYYGNTKSGYNYNDLCSNANQSQLCYIERVRVKKFDERVNRLVGNQIGGAIVEWDVVSYRDPRVYR